LLESSSGKLYGTTVNGGSYGWGVVFELDPDGTDYRVVKRFNYATHGGFLSAGLLQGSDGALYGAAAYGSDDDFGNVFRLVPTPNEAPTALAGSNQSVHAGTLTELNGTASLDDETSPAFLDYAWSFSSRPSGSTATLTDANTAFPSFTPDRLGTFVVQLIVTDEDGLSSTADTVEISSGNQAPTSVPAADFTVVVTGDLITFDASNSTDPDNDVLTYNWSFTSVPSRAGNVEFLDPQAEQPTFKPDVAGEYEVSLTVTDPWGAESTMPITITATAP
jgi:uncharacterized repeat protein (TIGR03803 family)